MEVKAQLNNLRVAPRKVRAVAGLVRGKNVKDALHQFDYYIRRPVEPIKKLLNSAIANAENNFNMVKENLYVKSIVVDEGAKLRRFRAKGFGRPELIQKKTSNIKLILDERVLGLRGEKTTKIKKETTEEVDKDFEAQEMKQSTGGRPEIKREIGSKKGLLRNLGKRIFQRKTV